MMEIALPCDDYQTRYKVCQKSYTYHDVHIYVGSMLTFWKQNFYIYWCLFIVFIDLYSNITQDLTSHLKFACYKPPCTLHVIQQKTFVIEISTNSIDWTHVSYFCQNSNAILGQVYTSWFLVEPVCLLITTESQNYLYQKTYREETLPMMCHEIYIPIWILKCLPLLRTQNC